MKENLEALRGSTPYHPERILQSQKLSQASKKKKAMGGDRSVEREHGCKMEKNGGKAIHA